MTEPLQDAEIESLEQLAESNENYADAVAAYLHALPEADSW